MGDSLRRVGLNALFLDPGRSGGPETYLRELLPAMSRARPEIEFTVASTRRGAAALQGSEVAGCARVVGLPADEGQRIRRQVAEQWLLPRLAERKGWDVLHSLASIGPIRPRVRSVVTLHDVTFFRHQTFGRVTTMGMRYVVPRAAQAADALITGSAAARDEICAELGLDPARFAVVPHGAGRVAPVTPAPEPDVRRRYSLEGARVVLCVAAKRPHKNQELLLRALPLLSDDYTLLLAGHPEAYDAELRTLAAELGVTDGVRFADYVPVEDLEALWGIAACAAFPTRAEGFGLPVLEAMQRGVPVACSDIPVLREVGAGVPHYFGVDHPQSAAAAIEAAATDEQAARTGPARAAEFTWDRSAAGTLAAYDRAVAG